MTATTNVSRPCICEEAHQGRRKDEGRDQERHAGEPITVAVAAHQDKWPRQEGLVAGSDSHVAHASTRRGRDRAARLASVPARGRRCARRSYGTAEACRSIAAQLHHRPPCPPGWWALRFASRRSEGWTVAPSSLAWEPCSPRRSPPRRSKRGKSSTGSLDALESGVERLPRSIETLSLERPSDYRAAPHQCGPQIARPPDDDIESAGDAVGSPFRC